MDNQHQNQQNDLLSIKVAEGDVDALLAACNMSELLDMRLPREIGRHNNLEVWL